MSDRAAQPHSGGIELSGKYLNEKQSVWMEHWMQHKRRRATDNNLIIENKDWHETAQHFSLCNQGSEPSSSNALFGFKEGAGTQSSDNGNHSKKDRSNLLSFPVFNIHKNGGSKTEHVPGTQTGQCSEFKAASTGTIKPRNAYEFGHRLQETRNATTPNLELELLTPCSSYQDFNMDTMRMTNTLNGGEDVHLGPRMYAERTRHFLITEISIGVSDEGKIFRESMSSAKFNKNLGGFLSLSSTSDQIQPDLKLQILDSSTDTKDEDSRSIGRLNRVGNLTEETSSETHTVDVDASLENNHTQGLSVSRSNEAAASQGKSANTWLPDMNDVSQASDGSADEGERSTSRTHSLDLECLFSNNRCLSNSKSLPSHVARARAELGSRWVKRLKLSSSYTKYGTVGTKSSTLEEAPSYEKLRKLSIGSMSSQLAMDTHLNQSNGGKSSSALTSHCWIRRWCHDQTVLSKKLPIDTESSETPKVSYDQFEKKIFPSIAAMALMGKAMNGFRPCEFIKKGTFIVWNTNNVPRD